MRRGISPVVAVILLIAISVVAAVALYFYAGGLSTKQRTTETPIAISASAIDPAAGKIAIANLGSEALTLSSLNTADGTTCDFDGEVTIESGEQETCTMPPKRGTTILYGTDTGQAVVILSGTDIAETTFQGEGFSSSTWSQTTEADFDAGSYTNTSTGSDQVELNKKRWWHQILYSGAGNQADGKVYIKDNVTHLMYYDNAGGNYDIYYSNSSNWSTTVQITSNASDETQPSLAVDSTGVIHAVWRDGRDYGSSKTQIYYANSTNWSDQNAIATYNDWQRFPMIDVDSSDNIHVVWSDHRGSGAADGSIFYSNDSYWPSYVQLAGVGAAQRPSIDVDSSDIVHVTFTNGNDRPVGYTNSTNFSAVTYILITYYWTHPTILVDSTGKAHIAFGADNDASLEPHMRYVNSSNWSAIEEVSNRNSVEPYGSLVRDSSGTIHLFWRSADGTNYIYYSNSSNWSDYTEIASSSVSTPSLSSGGRAAVADTNDMIHVFWSDAPGGTNDLYYANSSNLYYDTGYFTSSILNVSLLSNFTTTSWTNLTGASTTMTVEGRVGNNTGAIAWGSWSTLTNGGSLNEVGNSSQYRVNFTTTSKDLTAILYDLTFTYQYLEGNLTYTVNSDSDLSWVALNKTCSGSTTTPYNESASGTFYTNTETVSTYCSYLVWGPGLANSTTYP